MHDTELRHDGADAPPNTGGEPPAEGGSRSRKAVRIGGQRRGVGGAAARPRRSPRGPAPDGPEAKRAEALARSAAAERALDALNHLLERALAGGAGAAGREAIAPVAAGERPRPPAAPTTAPAPDPDDPRYRPALGLLGRLLPAVRRARLERAEEAFRRDYAAWAATAERAEWDHAEAMRRHGEALAAWEARCRAQAEAVRRLCQRVLAARPDDPACLPRAFEIGHDAAAGVTVIDYRLPRPDDLPTLKGVRYVQSRDAVEEVRLKPAELNRLYDGVVCQLALRALHDLFEADAAGALGAIVFNGWVDEGPDGFADGRGRACILSVRAERRPFRALDLTKADPCACYRALDGVGGTRPHRLMPVAPLAVLPRAGGDDRAPGHTTASRPAKEATRLAPAAA